MSLEDGFELGRNWAWSLGLFKSGLGHEKLAQFVLHNWASTNIIVEFIRRSPR